MIFSVYILLRVKTAASQATRQMSAPKANRCEFNDGRMFQ